MLEDDFVSNEDEWYFNSIKRYNKLNMFELQKTPLHLLSTDPQSICVVSAHDETQSEITEYSVPDKTISEDSLIGSSDLNLKCGTFTDSIVSEVQVLYKKSRLFSSEEGVDGIVEYDLDSSSGQVKKLNHLKHCLVNPYIAVNYSSDSQLLLSKDSKSDSFIIDLNTGNTCGTINTADNLPISDAVVPSFVSVQSVAFLNRRTGNIKIFDVRTNKMCSQTKICPLLNSDTMWAFKSDFYRPFLNEGEVLSASHICSKIFLLSSNGSLFVYDSRNLNPLYINCNLNLEKNSDLYKQYFEVNCCPIDENIISVSGFNGNVYVFRIENEVKQIFMHDGHSHVENCDKDTVVTSHAWIMSNRGYNIVSCAQNKTLHLWKFM